MMNICGKRIVHCYVAAILWLCPLAHAQHIDKKETQRDRLLQHMDHDRRAPPDYGFGVNVPPPPGLIWKHKKPNNGPAALAFAPTQAAANMMPIPNGGTNASANGTFGPVLPWPIIPIHMALLPDGRVMSYGSDESGAQTGQIIYDVWDPSQGVGVDAHLLLPNQTNTDIFCSGLGLLTDGTLLITGGDTTINGVRNFANSKVNIFDPSQNQLNPSADMLYSRWYPSVVPLPDGTALIVGGLGQASGQDPTVLSGITVPELYNPSSGLSALPGADNGGASLWYYPPIFATSNGVIYDIDPAGTISTYTTSDGGGFQMLGTYLPGGLVDLPTVMFAPGKLLAIRAADAIMETTQTHAVDVVDLSGDQPVVTPTGSVPGGREWANATLLADGKVFVNGGSGEDNALVRVSYDAVTWDPATGAWTPAGTAQNFRLYHSAALLLLDGSVLTGGGGASGPVNNLNAEIYYPPYLFTSDGSGNSASRPTIVSAPLVAQAGQQVSLTMDSAAPIGRVTLLRMGAVTHSANLQQRFFDLPLSQSDNIVIAQLPGNRNDLLPGFYMIFAFSADGSPSVAQVLKVALGS